MFSILPISLAAPLIETLAIDIFNFIKIKTKNPNISHEDIYKSIYDYHIKMIDNLNHFKSLIYDNFTVPFNDIYYPLSVRRYSNIDVGESGNKIRIDKHIESLFEKNRCITILGPAGAGKSMITKQLFLSSLEYTKLIPFLIECRKIDSKETIFDYIKKVLFSYEEFSIADSVLSEILYSGKFLFIFDGYEEIVARNSDNKIKDLEYFTDKYYKNTYVITSRLANNAEYLSHFETYIICGLDRNDIHPFIDQQCQFISEGKKLADEIKSSIQFRELTTVDDPKTDYSSDNYDCIDLFSNPLLLSLFIKTFSGYPNSLREKCTYYDNIFETLWSVHDSIAKSGFYIHPKYYTEDVYKDILYCIGYLSISDNKIEFTKIELKNWLEIAINRLKENLDIEKIIYDLVSSISIIIEDHGVYSFLHKYLQEYFAAKFISKMTSEDKRLFYNNLTKTTSHIFSINLLSLLTEIDNISLFNYYLLPIMHNKKIDII